MTPKPIMSKDPPAPQSAPCLPVGSCQLSLHPHDRLKKKKKTLLDNRNAFFKNRHINDVLDGMRWIWTSVVWCPLAIGGSCGTASRKICSSSDSTRLSTSPLSSSICLKGRNTSTLKCVCKVRDSGCPGPVYTASHLDVST